MGITKEQQINRIRIMYGLFALLPVVLGVCSLVALAFTWDLHFLTGAIALFATACFFKAVLEIVETNIKKEKECGK